MSTAHPSTFPIENLIQLFHTDILSGLSKTEAKIRLEKYGTNQIKKEQLPSFLVFIIKQFRSVLMLIMVGAIGISIFTEHYIDAVVIFLIVIINAFIGAAHEYRSQNIIQSLRNAVPKKAKVIRDGKIQKILASHLVPGDIVIIESGDMIPADGRLFEANQLEIIESSLTGESLAVEKNTILLSEEQTIGDLKNMAFMNTFVVNGSGKYIVTATGMETEIGKISQQISLMKTETPLFQKRVDDLTFIMVISTLITALITFIIAFFFRGMEFTDIAYFTLASIVSGIPESLPVILTIVLSIAAFRMARKKAVVKNLPAIESLSSVDTIITDKTGTLTENIIFVEKLILPNLEEFMVTGSGWNTVGEIMRSGVTLPQEEVRNFEQLSVFLALSNNATLVKKKSQHTVIGDPTEASRLVLAEKFGFSKKRALEEFDILYESSYNQETKIRKVVLKDKNSQEKYSIIVGGAEQVVSFCSLTQEQSRNYLEVIEKYAAQAMRMQAIAYKEGENEENSVYHLMGILCMSDPVRKDVALAIEKAQNAGIRVIIATGDHKETARAVAIRVGLLDASAPDASVMTENELITLSDREFEETLMRVSVFARLTPQMKLRIADTMNKKGKIFAMTGDGINDALALKKANVGIAMGTIGTDVAREAADIIIVDDNFATIVNGIVEGRTVFSNLRNTSLFLITTNLSEDFMILLALFAGLPLPLLPLQILWLNLVTDGTSDLALATEEAHEDTLKRPPIPATEGIFTPYNFLFILSTAVIMAIVAFFVFFELLPKGENAARTGVFLVLGFTQLWNMFNMRSLKHSVFQIGIFQNKSVIYAFLFSTAIAFLVVSTPVIASFFGFTQVGIIEFLGYVILSSLVFFFGELIKVVLNFFVLFKLDEKGT